ASICIRQALVKKVCPTLRERCDLHRAAEKLLIWGMHRVKIDDVSDCNAIFLPLGEFNGIVLLNVTLTNHGEVEPTAFALKKTFHHVATAKSNPEFEAGNSCLRDYDLG